MTTMLVWAVLLTSLPASLAFGTGAPAAACPNLMPIHIGISGQTTPSPYSFSVGSTTYTPGTPITVTVMGGAFGGFILQARRQGMTTSVGTFTLTPTTTQLRQCTVAADTITHTSTAAKENLQITWNPPSADMGAVVFMGSVASNKTTWWGVLSSSPVVYQASSGGEGLKGSLLFSTVVLALGLATRVM